MYDIVQSLWIGSTTLSNVEKLAITSFLQNGHDFHLGYTMTLNTTWGTSGAINQIVGMLLF